MAAVGQRNGTVAAEIRSGFMSRTDSDATHLSSQYTQQVNNTCTTLDYTVFLLSDSVILGLHAGFPCYIGLVMH